MKAHKKFWILVADGRRARILEYDDPETGLRPATSSDYVADSRPSRERGSDRPGRVHESASSLRHAIQPRVDWHDFEEVKFAHEMAKLLNKARLHRAFDQLVLVAPPRSLGELRKALDRDTLAVVAAELDKDLTKLATHELPSHLGPVLPS